VAWGENEAFLTLQRWRMLTARLVVGADGANSWLRNKADIPLTFWDYRHHALVATIRTEERTGGGASGVSRRRHPGVPAAGDPHLCSLSGRSRRRKQSGCSRRMKSLTRR
jgi:2-octaprenylphenol hydroxylase